MDTELVAVGSLLTTAALDADSRSTVRWCCGQLPALYRQYLQTRESRYGAEILRLARGVLQKLAEAKAKPTIGETVTGHLKALHERLGLPELDLAPHPRRKKAA